MSYSVYILKSIGSARYYIGSTDDVPERLAEHNSPRAHWTKRYQPWKLVFEELYETRAEAVRRERFLKSLKGISRYIDELSSGRK